MSYRLIYRVSEVDKDMHSIFDKVSLKNKKYEERYKKKIDKQFGRQKDK